MTSCNGLLDLWKAKNRQHLMISYIKTKLKEIRDRREAKIKADLEVEERQDAVREESMSRLIKNSNDAMTSKPCPFVEGNCRIECVHFRRAQRIFFFHPAAGTAVEVKPAGCKLWGSKINQI